MMFAARPPFLIVRWRRAVGRTCSRMSARAWAKISTASSALRPSHGFMAACAVFPKNSTSIAAIDVEFFGKTAHAAMNPWLGRSALDAVEIFAHALALMREHVLPPPRL